MVQRTHHVAWQFCGVSIPDVSMGNGIAIVGAYVLAGELHAAREDYAAGLRTTRR
jgi:hypothetical protein